MKVADRVILLFIVVLTSLYVNADDLAKVMRKNGLPARVSVKVIDQSGLPVPDTSVKFCFFLQNIENANIVFAKTDEKGVATGEANANEIVTMHFDKDGYYWSFVKYELWGQGKGYETGHWEPWNPTVEIKLKKVIKPRRNKLRYRDVKLPMKRFAYGFDLELGELVEPYGLGKQADLTFECDSAVDGDDNFWRSLILRIPDTQDGCGFLRIDRDTDSKLKFRHEAPQSGYTNTICFSDTYGPTKKTKGVLDQKIEYLAFKILRPGKNGQPPETHFGIFSWLLFSAEPSVDGKAGLTLVYSMNEEPDDRNTEYSESWERSRRR